MPPVGQRPQPDVDPAVAHREDPAVPGEIRAAVREAEVRPQLQVLLPRALGAAVVPPGGGGDLPPGVPLQPQRQGEAGGRPVGRDDDRGAEVERTGDVRGVGGRGDPRDPARPVGQRPFRLPAAVQPGPGRHGVPGQDVVEVVPAAGEPEVRIAAQRGPLDVHPVLSGHPAHPARTRPARRGDVHAHPDQLVHRSGGEAVAAHLLPGEAGLLQKDHVHAGARQVVRGRGAGRPGPHHDHLGVLAGTGDVARVRLRVRIRVRVRRPRGGGQFPHDKPFVRRPVHLPGHRSPGRHHRSVRAGAVQGPGKPRATEGTGRLRSLGDHPAGCRPPRRARPRRRRTARQAVGHPRLSFGPARPHGAAPRAPDTPPGPHAPRRTPGRARQRAGQRSWAPARRTRARGRGHGRSRVRTGRQVDTPVAGFPGEFAGGVVAPRPPPRPDRRTPPGSPAPRLARGPPARPGADRVAAGRTPRRSGRPPYGTGGRAPLPCRARVPGRRRAPARPPGGRAGRHRGPRPADRGAAAGPRRAARGAARTGVRPRQAAPPGGRARPRRGDRRPARARGALGGGDARGPGRADPGGGAGGGRRGPGRERVRGPGREREEALG